MVFGTHEYDRVAIQLSENKVHDVVAHFLVHDVVALITYYLPTGNSQALTRSSLPAIMSFIKPMSF